MNKRYDEPLTTEQFARLTDDEVDTSDIPELDEKFWINAKLTPPRTSTNINVNLQHATRGSGFLQIRKLKGLHNPYGRDTISLRQSS